MIPVSALFQTALDSDLRNIIYKVEISRKDNYYNFIDITDKIMNIKVDGNLDSNSLSCNIDIDNADYSYTPTNISSNVNLVNGKYNPLIYPGHMIRIFTGFSEAIEDETVVTAENTIKISKFDNLASSSNVVTGLYSGNITLDYTLGNEYINRSYLTNNIGWNVGDYFFNPGTKYYKACQEFILTGNSLQRVSKLLLYYKNGEIDRDDYIDRKTGDSEFYIKAVLDKVIASAGGTWDQISPPYNESNKSITYEYNINDNDEDGTWLTLTAKSNCFIEPGEKYIFNVEDNHKKYYGDDNQNDTFYGGSGSVVSGCSLWRLSQSSMADEFPLWSELTGNSLAYKIYTRNVVYKTSGNAYYIFDCGEDICKYVSFSSNSIIPNETTLNYEYCSSIDNISWTDWNSDLDSVEPSRYLQVKAIMTTTNTNYSPRIIDYSLTYNLFSEQPEAGMISIFYGLIGDEIDAESTPGMLNLTCRDFSKNYQDLYIVLCDTTYTKIWAEEIIKDLLKKYTGETILSSYLTNVNDYFIYTPSEFLIKDYALRAINLWESFQKISDCMGWYLKFNESGKLVLENRKKYTTPDVIFDEDIIIKNPIRLSDADVRNIIVVKAETSSDGVVEATGTSIDSINMFGKRYMEVDRSLSSMISTQEQVNNLAQAILEDYAWLQADISVELPFYPTIQTGDIIGIRNTNLGLNENIEVYKVSSFSHSLSEQNKRTTLGLKTHKNFIYDCSYYPYPPSDLSGNIISRTIHNYSGSSWTGNIKTFYYPQINLVEPSLNSNGTDISYLSGYKFYRSNVNVYPFASGTLTNVITGSDNEIALIPSSSTYIDQINNTGNGTRYQIKDRNIKQTFTSSGGSLYSIQLYLDEYSNGSTAKITLTNYSNTKTYGSSKANVTSSGWTTFTFPSGINLISGNMYMMKLSSSDEDNLIHVNTGVDYSGGDFFYRGTKYSDRDAAFKVNCSTYKVSGDWTSGLFDFGDIPTAVTISSNISIVTGTAINFYYKNSDDNITWSDWVLETGNTLPNNRYYYLKYELTTTNLSTPKLISSTFCYTVDNVSNNYYIGYSANTYNYVGFVPIRLAGLQSDLTWFIDYGSGPGRFEYKVVSTNLMGKSTPLDSGSTITINVPNPTEA